MKLLLEELMFEAIAARKIPENWLSPVPVNHRQKRSDMIRRSRATYHPRNRFAIPVQVWRALAEIGLGPAEASRPISAKARQTWTYAGSYPPRFRVTEVGGEPLHGGWRITPVNNIATGPRFPIWMPLSIHIDGTRSSFADTARHCSNSPLPAKPDHLNIPCVYSQALSLHRSSLMASTTWICQKHGAYPRWAKALAQIRPRKELKMIQRSAVREQQASRAGNATRQRQQEEQDGGAHNEDEQEWWWSNHNGGRKERCTSPATPPQNVARAASSSPSIPSASQLVPPLPTAFPAGPYNPMGHYTPFVTQQPYYGQPPVFSMPPQYQGFFPPNQFAPPPSSKSSDAQSGVGEMPVVSAGAQQDQSALLNQTIVPIPESSRSGSDAPAVSGETVSNFSLSPDNSSSSTEPTVNCCPLIGEFTVGSIFLLVNKYIQVMG
ncbi:hypothetical protein DFH08DRAFT_807175 [Mycena albidolilacea]|uniref:Uncharacterized protein n=1 Tax=Mycena albidolilacea TaxID=1033008 RepID=A0AAD7A5H7_9AGAR|nr:hypothetical protein DFH08DRAFT_807175 [Mycena albidolilacea]